MKLNSKLTGWILGAVCLFSQPACTQAATDYNEVGKQVAVILQNVHFDRLNKDFDDALSAKIFDQYLKELDPLHIFFTQEDIKALNKKYGAEIDRYMLDGQALIPAKDIYDVFNKRVKERITYAKKLLKDDKFKFASNKTVERLRKKSAWPVNDAEANALWKDRVEEQLLTEILRRETITKLAKEQGKPDPTASEKTPIERLTLRYDRILRTFTEVDDEDISNQLLSAASHVYDPHTDYMSARETDRFKSAMKGSLIGIGALLGEEDDGSTKINGIVVGGPADKSGELKLNDHIVAVDTNNSGEMVDILFMKIDHVVDLIRGKEGSSVRLKVESPDSPGQARIVTLKRSSVEMKDELIKGKIIEEKIANGNTRKLGLIVLPSFYFDMDKGAKRCGTDMEKLLKRMNKENVDGLVIDLRNNGGGSLEEVRRMVGFFVGFGPVVQVKDTRGTTAVLKSDPVDAFFTKPVVVLINKLSASASEIMAAALQDYGRAIIAGDTSSFGKGTVQQTIDVARFLPYFSDPSRAGMLKITIQKFYRIAGGSTQHKGVISDIVLPTITAALDIGESQLDYPLPYDSITPSPDYKKSGELTQILPTLKLRSQERVANDEDFKLLSTEIARTKKRLDENTVSINKGVREKEMSDQETWRKDYVKSCNARYPAILKNDKNTLTIYRLNLEDLETQKLPISNWEEEKDSTMKMAKDDLEDLTKLPDVPSGLDSETREGFNILNDIIDLKGQKLDKTASSISTKTCENSKNSSKETPVK